MIASPPFAENEGLFKKITGLRRLRDEIGRTADTLRLHGHEELSDEEVESKVADLAEQDEAIKAKLSELADEWHSAFHPRWGAMFHAGYQDSRFAFYVQNYACLYTSRATNLGLLSSQHSFRTSMEMVPHDRLLSDSSANQLVDENPW